MMVAVQVSAQPVIANVSQRNETGTQQCSGTLTIFAKQGVPGKSGKNQKAKTAQCRQTDVLFLCRPHPVTGQSAERNNGPKQPDMECLIAQNEALMAGKTPTTNGNAMQ